MHKRLACIAVLLTAACGSEISIPQGSTSADVPGDEGPRSGVSLALAAGTTSAKVIVRRGIMQQVPDFDEDGEMIGIVDQFVEVFRYITNIDPNATSTLNIPYGENYVIEVVARGATGVLAYHRSGYFDVPETLAPALPEQPPPAIAFPDVYVGLGPPFDRYTVALGNELPFSGAWSLTCGGQAPVSTTFGTATFRSPTAAGTIACDARFRLHPSLLIGGEPASAWEWAVHATHDPLPFGEVTVTPP